ncbi:hypothetical protein MKX07_003749 [Trichoderma sp. CBMAI-0711]|nr:hypothetical protein MKX07_003749 [Trichoderma sp. CBMAI-0711]
MKSTPFHFAAERGKPAIIQIMKDALQEIEEAYHGSIYAVIQGADPDKPRMTALHYAAEARNDSLETLKVILSFDCFSESDKPDPIFKNAVRDGAETVTFKSGDPKKRQSYMEIITALIKLLDGTDPLSTDVVESIIEQQAKGERQAESQLPQGTRPDSMQLDWMEIWKALQARPEGLLGTTKDHLLHLAVYHQSLAFVTEFLQHPTYSASVTCEMALPKSNARVGRGAADEHYPLWFNGKTWNDGDGAWRDRTGSSEIHAKLVSSTIRKTNRMRKLTDIFYKSGRKICLHKVRELCFDISHFNSKQHRVSEFVDSLIQHSENENLLSYEETLRYVEFPALDIKVDDKETFPENAYLPSQHTEVFDTLKWLQEQKGVRQIVELKVPDRLINPHDEKRIAEYVAKFEVECLDWRCLDLPISVFGSHKPENSTDLTIVNDKIKELHLYSSGRRAVIDHWLGSNGIPTLTKASAVIHHSVVGADFPGHSSISFETVTEEHCKEIVDFIIDGLYAMQEKYPEETRNFTVGYGTVDSIFWNPTHTLVDLNEIAHRITPRLAKFLRSLGDYVPREEKQAGQKLRRTRVAIIDNGILSIAPKSYDRSGKQNKESNENRASSKSPGSTGSPRDFDGNRMRAARPSDDDQKPETTGKKSLWSSIKAGRSFVDDGSKMCPWMLASDPHGTQMANIICAMDPFCELYVARVAEGKYGITPERAARAIDWALENDVDIISMSIALLDKGDGDFEKSCNRAKEKGVIIVCSTHDEGTRAPTSYPADWNPGFVITACDEYGRQLHSIEKEKFNYMLLGQNITAGVIPFIDSSDSITGSSVSTALAAGLSSLILTCNRLVHLQKVEDERMRHSGYLSHRKGQKELVEKYLKTMLAEGTDNHVVLEKFGKIDSTTRMGDEILAEKVLETFKKEIP